MDLRPVPPVKRRRSLKLVVYGFEAGAAG